MSDNQTTPPEPPSWDEIHTLLIKQQNENLEAGEDIPPMVKLANLSQDADYFKKLLGFAVVAFVALIGALWTAYIHVDEKIEHAFVHLDGKLERKMDYLNGRIDKVIIKNKENSD